MPDWRIAERLRVSDKSGHEWRGVTGRTASLNIHFSTSTLWITEKMLMDSIRFCSSRFLQLNQCCIYGYELSSVLFLHSNTSTDAVKQIASFLRPVGNQNSGIKCCVKSGWEFLFSWLHTPPASCLITLSVCRDVQTCIKSYRQLAQLIWCTVLCWFKELGWNHLSYIHRLVLSTAFIYYAHRSRLWCQLGHYLWQCLVRLPLPII